MQDDWLDGLTLRQCEARLQESTLTLEERVRLWGHHGHLLFEQGDHAAAIASYEQALALKPDDADATYQRALALDALGRYREALAGFDRAIALQPKAAQIWCDRGHAQIRGARQYKAAIASYDRAIALDPDLAEAWSGRGFALGLLGKFDAAVKSCQRAVDLEPDAARILSNMGAVLSLAKRNTEALGYFDRAIALEPEFNKTWNNRGIVFVSLHRYEEALTNFETSLTLPSPRHESWYPLAWLNHGLVLQRMGRHREAIASFEKSQLLNPTLLQTAVLKLFSLVMSGAVWGYATGASTRGLLLRDLGTILNSLKYVLLALVVFFWLSNAAEGPWAEAAKRAISLLFSAGIVTLMVVELWKRKSTLGFVWRVYFRSGFLTYIRAIAILTVTLITAVVLTLAVPPFMRLGWADLVFGQSGNIIFQPLQMAKDAPLPEAETPATDLPLTNSGSGSANPGSANPEDSTSQNPDPASPDPASPDPESLLNGGSGDR
ncbi:MAG TPA: tetratricopeptide repeat protein, partial [Chroococcidiopsis sp.]